jgi:hypothetical protein
VKATQWNGQAVRQAGADHLLQGADVGLHGRADLGGQDDAGFGHTKGVKERRFRKISSDFVASFLLLF